MRWSDHLSRRTTSGRYIPVIDGLRFVSIFLVVAFHISGYLALKSGLSVEQARVDPLARFLEHGHYGVQIFFAISGFVLALPFAAHHLQGAPRVPLRDYFLRRLTRLEPPYLLAMALASLGTAAVGVGSERLGPHLAASLVYLHNLIYHVPSTVLPVAWSLEVEVQFYLLAPLLCTLLFRPRGRLLRRGVMLGSMVAVVFAQHAFGPRLTPSLIWHIQYFLAGIFVAELYLVDWAQRPQGTLSWDALMLAACAGLYACWEYPNLPGAIAFPLLLVLMFVGAFRGRISNRVLSAHWIAVIGGMCYSIYLLHYMVVSMVGRFTVPVLHGSPLWAYILVHLVLSGAVVLLVSTIFFVLVERPCMRRDWPRRAIAAIRSALERVRGAPADAALEAGAGDR